MNIEENVGRRVRECREARGLTQQQLGSMLHRPMLQGTVAKLERGQRPLRLNEVAELAALFGVPGLVLWPEVSGPEMDPALPSALHDAALHDQHVSHWTSEVQRMHDVLANVERELREAQERQGAAHQRVRELRQKGPNP